MDELLKDMPLKEARALTDAATLHDNVLLSCDNTNLPTYMQILSCAIVKATGIQVVEYQKLPILNINFVQSILSEQTYDEYLKTCPNNPYEYQDYSLASDSDSESEEITGNNQVEVQSMGGSAVLPATYGNTPGPRISEEITVNTEHSLGYSDFSTPLTDEDLISLDRDLRNRQRILGSAGCKSVLRHLGITIDKSRTKVVVKGDPEEVHPLLTRLFKQHRNECFTPKKSIGDMSINQLIQNFIKLSSSGCKLRDYDLSVPLTNDEIQCLINDLRTRQANVQYGTLNKTLNHLTILVNPTLGMVVAGTDDIVHPLLSRLYNQNRDLFYSFKSMAFGKTIIDKLVTDLQSMLPN
jgi:hypothetical protein